MTRLTLFPTRVVLMNFEGFFTKGLNKLAMVSPCLLFSSKRSLLDEMKAISIPEKNAQEIRVNSMTIE